MVQQRSFQKYVSKHHENDLFDAVASFIPDNLDEIHLWSYNIDVDNLDEENVSFDDMKVEQVFVNEETLTNDIEFDVLVSGAIYFSECDRHNDYEDSCNAWFRVNCRATIDGELKNFKVHDVETYDKKKNRFHRRLSDALVPIISSEDVEFEAEQFLTMYFPEAMEIPQRVDPLLIAEKMGLTVEYHEISEDGNIFGQIYFHDALLDGKEIKAKTILIDPRVIESRGIGGLNNTIMHECVHWHKHRLAFELVRLFQPELSNITTSVDEFKEIVTSNMTPTDWMELQARVITPKILMPRKMVAQEIEMKQRELSAQGVSDLDATKLKIEYLAGYFGVSILSAKIRMVELGYEEAIGAFNYIDGDYVPLHRWKKGALEANQTYSLGLIDATIQMLGNPALQGNEFVYVESHFCLNSPEYIEKDIFGKTRLTDYARLHMDECCLSFTLSMKSNSGDQSFAFECILNRDERSGLTFNVAFGRESNLSVLERANQMKEDQEGLKKVLGDIAPLEFGPALTYLMKQPPKLSNEKLAEYAGLSDKTIGRMRNGVGTSVQSVVAVCIGLQLHPDISATLLQKIGCILGPPVEINMIYKNILCNCNTQSIEECNDLLVHAGFDPLTKS
ncbi:ImmA/IrrE family metallo-endopeptidase [Enterococcus faecalis]|uniref:ImmA/IrrE family metallo-endopeptidase n=2 Tax=Enterococcus faecalis TaxID=1351 RepID=UPI003D6B14CF